MRCLPANALQYLLARLFSATAVLLLLGCGLQGAPEPLLRPSLVRVVMDNSYPPYAFTDAEGRLQGILVDRWQLFEKRTGIKVQLIGLDWDSAMRRMREGDFDVIDTIFKSPERETWLTFSKPHSRLEVCLFFDSEITGISDLASARDFAVAGKTGDLSFELARKAGVSTLLAYKNYESIVAAAKVHKVQVFIMDKPPALHFLHRQDIRDRFKVSQPFYVGYFHRAVLRSNAALLSAVEDGFGLISQAEIDQIDEKWMGSSAGDGKNLRMLAIIGGIGLLLCIGLFVWNQSLRWHVSKRTAALSESEARFRETIEFMPVPLGICDDQGTISYVNREFTRLFGYTLEDLPNIDAWFEKAYPDPHLRQQTRTHYEEDIRQSREQVIMKPGRSTFITCKDGSQKEVEVSMRHFASQFLTAFTDLTERKHLENQLIQAQKMDAIGQLAGGVAHDFNNLLASMLLNVSLLQMQASFDGPTLKTLADIRSEIEKAADLTRQLLAFGRRQALKIAPLDLNDLLLAQSKMIQRLLGERISLQYKSGESLPRVRGNPGMIEQVVMNLCVNSRDAMPNGGTLSLETRLVAVDEDAARQRPEGRPGSYVELCVRDTGIGMGEEVRRRIFEPFFTTKELGRGTGLGLSIVFGIVKQHGGWIEVDSSEGVGSAFHVFFPASDESSPREAQVVRQEPATGRNEAILLVEDEAAVRSAICSGLLRIGYHVQTAADAADARLAWQSHSMNFDVLLTDMIMPGGTTGMELARELCSQKPSLKIIVASGYSEDSPETQVPEGLKAALIQKPFTIEELAKLIRRVLDS